MAGLPNIVFLLNDHQAYYRHGWDGGPGVQRPHFDRLASEGIEFSRAYTACPLCGPARRTMLTGLYPHNHGEVWNDLNIPFRHEVYLDTLASLGYRNFYYGKWHAGPGTALDHHCEGLSYPSYNNPYTKAEYKAYLEARGLPEPEVLIERSFWKHVPGLREGALYRCEMDWCNEHASGIWQAPEDTFEAFYLANLACDRLRDLAETKDRQPFSLRVDFWGPHQPYFPTRAFADRYNPEEIPEYGSFRDTLENKGEIHRKEYNHPLNEKGRLIVPSPLPWEEWQKVLARCYAQITMIDAAGGRILDALEELGLAENTLVVWTTDHGDALASHGGHFDKGGYMTEEVMRIPMAVRWPGRIPAGRKSTRFVSNLDLGPTLLDAAGTRYKENVDGRSLLPLCAGETEGWREDLVCEPHGHGDPHVGRMVVRENYKYVAQAGMMHELYDLEKDPFEMENLVEDPGLRDVLMDMKKRLLAWQRKTGDGLRG